MKATNGTTRTDTQFSVIMANKPHTLAQICQRLADDRVNIVAFSMMDANEHGVLRIVVEDPVRARKSLAALNVPTTESTVVLTDLPHRPGAWRALCTRLAREHISVGYAYLSTGTSSGKTMGVFRVSDIKKAMQVLQERRPVRRQTLLPRPTPRQRKARV